MVQIFKRYISLRNILYFIFENGVILFLLDRGIQMHPERATVLLVPLVCQIFLYCQGLYPDFPRFSFRLFWAKYLKSSLFSGLILFFICLFIPLHATLRSDFWRSLLAFPFLVSALRLAYQALVSVEKLDIPVLVIGSGPLVEKIRALTASRGAAGFRLLYFNWDTTQEVQERLEALQSLVAKKQLKKIVIGINKRRGHLPLDFLLELRLKGVQIVGATSFYEQLAGKFSVDSLKPSELIFSDGFHRATILRYSKRMIDLVASCLGILLLSPCFVLLPILIKLSSPGSVFYQQERLGEKGKPFTILKFRSMRENAEADTGPVWANENDPRITRIGKIMRTLRLDELPQLINVIQGEMSLVGPRPERQVFIKELEQKIPYYRFRLTVKPGLTGWAQVKYRYGASKEDSLEKLQYDLYYVKHLSPFFDITILLETLRVVFAGQGAR